MPLPDKMFHTLSVEQTIQDLDTDAHIGLRIEQAMQRLYLYGQNTVGDKQQKSILSTLGNQFSNPIVWILLLAMGAALAFRHFLEAVAVLVVIVLNTLIGFLMERQAVRSMEKLRSMARAKAMVIRNGEKSIIDSTELVPGDLLYLQAGDVVTADARVIFSANLALDESALTGESWQVDKSTGILPTDLPIADRVNIVFKGSLVNKGIGKAVVFATGPHTELGKITAMAQNAEKQATPLNRKLRVLSVRLIWLTMALTALIFASGLIRKEPFFLMLETAIALAIACIPEGLPVISTLSLARGMLGLAKRNVVVKTLDAVQTLGETQVIFTDKTGTLTENEMHVQVIALDGIAYRLIEGARDKEKFKNHPSYGLFLTVATLCNNAVLREESDRQLKDSGDPEEVALLHLIRSLSESFEDIQRRYPRIAEVPFDSTAKVMATLHEFKDGYLVCVKGAWEAVSARSSKIYRNGRVRDFDDRNQWMQKVEAIASSGMRVLGFAFRILKDKPADGEFMENLVFIGVAGFIDPARNGVRESILVCQAAGIRVVMVTGDHPGTADAIASDVGLLEGRQAINIQGKDLQEKQSSKEGMDRLLQATVFSRLDPGQKLDLVSIYQQSGIVVGMTGDGVNDAPALRKADIGIAMGIRGTGAAKEAADLIINDDAFVSIVVAVQYGRVIFENIRTFVIYLLSCNLSEILIVAVASLANMPMPLLPLQILFLNMVTDVFPALAIGMSKGDIDIVMKKPPRKSMDPIISKAEWISIGVYAACLTAGVLGAEFYVWSIPGTDNSAINNVTFCTLILAQLWNVLNMPDRQSPFFKNQVTRSRYVWLAIIFCLGITGLAYWVPVLRSALTLRPFEQDMLAAIVTASLLPVALIQLLKRGFKIVK